MAYYVQEDVNVTIANAIQSLKKRVKLGGVLLFGSQADGTAGPDSDIDLAAFIECHTPMSLRERVDLAVAVQREAGDRIELHCFPLDELGNPRPGSLAEYVVEHGVRIDPGKGG